MYLLIDCPSVCYLTVGLMFCIKCVFIRRWSWPGLYVSPCSHALVRFGPPSLSNISLFFSPVYSFIYLFISFPAMTYLYMISHEYKKPVLFR